MGGNITILKRIHKRFINSLFDHDYKLDQLVFPGQRIPRIPGIYFLFDNDLRLVYIGQSINIHNRMKSHHVYEFGKHIIGLWTTSDNDERLDTERWLIQQYQWRPFLIFLIQSPILVYDRFLISPS